MKAFKVTYTDGTSYTTNANGTAESFYAYLTQFGPVVTDENPATGEETRHTIEKVEEFPAVGEVYAFKYFDEICPLVVTEVDDTHIYYKFPDANSGNMEYNRSYPMVFEIWFETTTGRALIGTTTDPDALAFCR